MQPANNTSSTWSSSVSAPMLNEVVDLTALDLGHAARDRSFRYCLTTLATAPALHLTESFPTPTRVYDMCANDYVSYEQTIAPTLEHTRRASAKHQRVLVLHDTTENSWAIHRDQLRLSMPSLSKNRQGFFWHVSLMVADTPQHEPLAVVAAQPYVHASDIEDDDEATRQFWCQRGGLYDSEQQRYTDNLIQCEQRLASTTTAIHVIDRDGDDFKLLNTLQQRGHDLVIRAAQSRRVRLDGLDELVDFDQALTGCKPLATRSLEVAYRAAKRARSKEVPARIERVAQLELRAVKCKLQPPTTLSKAQRRELNLADELDIWLLEAREVHAPDGQEPIVWRLLTTLPIDTLQDAEYVLSCYQARWQIEEYFKALKTGCGYRKRQLESAHSLLNLLALSAPIALQLLRLRHLSRYGAHRRASEFLSPTQLKILASLVKKAPEKPLEEWTIVDAFETIGLLGGWQRAPSRPLGWLVLGRGYQRLLDYETGWQAAMNMRQAE